MTSGGADVGAAAVLLDTHVLVWWLTDAARLSAKAAEAVDSASTVHISAVSGWELALLVDAGRLRLDRPTWVWMRDVLAQHRVEPLPLDAVVAISSVELGRRGFHRDPADRFLWATAARHRLPLVTKDADIHAFGRTDGSVQLLW